MLDSVHQTYLNNTTSFHDFISNSLGRIYTESVKIKIDPNMAVAKAKSLFF